MKIDQLIEKLQALREETKYCNLQVCTKLVEPYGIWFGEFDIDDIQMKCLRLAKLQSTGGIRW